MGEEDTKKEKKNIRKNEYEIRALKTIIKDHMHTQGYEDLYDYNKLNKEKEENKSLKTVFDECVTKLKKMNEKKYEGVKNENIISYTTLIKYIKDIEAEDFSRQRKVTEKKATAREIKALVKDCVSRISIIQYQEEKYIKSTDKFKTYNRYKILIILNDANYVHQEKLCDVLYYKYHNSNKIKYIESHYGALVIHCTSLEASKGLKTLLRG